ncbi:hypothetical protein llap_6902 [Limosa lapponica baueri]|uniref:Uncharacterized protein n=1 Tax=Limosa lapponica baueri TaxID=1758121 RepID=A0A2I0U9R2_LIMLA|nr:hypothetical protein llap_6902 [Limosa lapponica baueri]
MHILVLQPAAKKKSMAERQRLGRAWDSAMCDLGITHFHPFPTIQLEHLTQLRQAEEAADSRSRKAPDRMPWPLAGRDGADSHSGEAPSRPMPLTVTPSKDGNEWLWGKKGRGTPGEREEEREAETAAVWQKRLQALLRTVEETIKNAPNIKYCDEDRNYRQPIIKIWSSRRVLLAIRRLICHKQNFATTMNIILQFTGLSES